MKGLLLLVSMTTTLVLFGDYCFKCPAGTQQTCTECENYKYFGCFDKQQSPGYCCVQAGGTYSSKGDCSLGGPACETCQKGNPDCICLLAESVQKYHTP